MGASDIAQAIMTALGGLALFLYGLTLMTRGLPRAAGAWFGTLLARVAQRRRRGLILGAVLGLLIQSSATTVMLVGLVHAGLMTLEGTVPVMLGANVGTTFALQLISFRIGRYAFLLVLAGFLMRLARGDRLPAGGEALLGFGLLFLGINTMSEAIHPFRAVLAPWLATIDGRTVAGMLLGIGVSLAVTGIIQSSGAVLGMTFALISAGALTRFEQAYPIILGANIGTCVTGLLGSLGTNIEARRSALSHLLFNVFGAIVGVALAPVFYRVAPHLGGGLVRQVANANSLKMIVSAALVLPVAAWHVRLVRLASPSRRPPEPKGHLEEPWLARPEDALVACLREVGRALRVCRQSHRVTARLILEPDRAARRTVLRNEEAIDRIKANLRDYLRRLTGHYLSRRQAIMIEGLDRMAADFERVHDHLKRVVTLSKARYGKRAARFEVAELDGLYELYHRLGNILDRLIEGVEPNALGFYEGGSAVLAAVQEFARSSAAALDRFTRKVGRHEYPALSGIYYSEYLAAFNSTVRHASAMAETLCGADFWIKDDKRGRPVARAPAFLPPLLVDVDAYLEEQARRHRDDRGERPGGKEEEAT